MEVKQFRDAVEQLGRFANVRDKAPEPTDRIYIRVLAGVLTIVAGDNDKMVRIQSTELNAGEGRALVSARLLLTAGKALRGKGTVGFAFDHKGGATLTTSTGGKVVLPCVGQTLPDWLRPSAFDADARASVPAGFWPIFAKLVDTESELLSHTGGAVAMKVEGSNLRLTWAHQYIHLTTLLPLTGGALVTGDVGGLPLDFVKSLRGLDDRTNLDVRTGPTHVTAEGLVAVTFPVAMPTYRLNEPDVTTHVRCDRKALLNAVKALPVSDEHKRVTLNVGKGTVQVRDYKTPSSVEVTASTTGQVPANVTLVSTRLAKLLAALPGDEVNIGLDANNDAPVAFEEGRTWRVFLAPVRR